ncbi:MAG: hypothetical protein CM1200mP23_3410 [Nitrososphaerota archaeon]|nr:MAG: hypothetical protein CM1200mP23_3410 [Nitrososphaerota archaeon]
MDLGFWDLVSLLVGTRLYSLKPFCTSLNSNEDWWSDIGWNSSLKNPSTKSYIRRKFVIMNPLVKNFYHHNILDNKLESNVGKLGIMYGRK